MPFNPILRGRFPVMKFNGKMLDLEFGKNLNDKAAVIKRYNEHNEEVLRVVPKERLLLFNVKDGWEPLCKFLDKQVPSTPFPKSNTREEFIARIPLISTKKEFV